jgi:hypothetical protein
MYGGTGAAAAAVVRAIKASGVIVHVTPEEFRGLVDQNAEGLVVHAPGGFLGMKHKYLTGYRGLAFYTISPEILPMPGRCQVVEAKSIWVPHF